MKNRINGLARWILVVIALGTIAYNSIVTHVVMKNEIKHFDKRLVKVEQKVERIYEYLLENK